jgi:hypothetical protein
MPLSAPPRGPLKARLYVRACSTNDRKADGPWPCPAGIVKVGGTCRAGLAASPRPATRDAPATERSRDVGAALDRGPGIDLRQVDSDRTGRVCADERRRAVPAFTQLPLNLGLRVLAHRAPVLRRCRRRRLRTRHVILLGRGPWSGATDVLPSLLTSMTRYVQGRRCGWDVRLDRGNSARSALMDKAGSLLAFRLFKSEQSSARVVRHEERCHPVRVARGGPRAEPA